MTTPAIRATDVTKRYGDLTAVNGISLEVHPGEIFGIIGPNGAGKTTFMECLEGLRRPTSGTIDVLGEDPSRPSTRWRERIGVQLQTAALPPKITVNEAMALFASMYSDPADPTQLLNELGIAAKGRSYVDKLSGGQRQRVLVARALVARPDLVMMDEPFNGLDAPSRDIITGLIADLTADGIGVNEIYFAINTDIYDLTVTLPSPASGNMWYRIADTSIDGKDAVRKCGDEELLKEQYRYVLPSDSLVLLISKRSL